MIKKTAIQIFSGGLDSILSAKIIADFGFNIIALYFKQPFYKYTFKEKQTNLEKIINTIQLRIIPLKNDYIQILKNPKHGYGKHYNPCIDCHIFFLKKAKEIMIKENAEFVFSGEVNGQRPMSQRKNILRLVEKESGLDGYLLRPLSAKTLPQTIPEKKGIVDRNKLYDITGRSRKRQIQLAKEFGIKDYPSPAGGCLLTVDRFSDKMKEYIVNNDKYTEEEMSLLNIGRHFRTEKGSKIIISRNEFESNLFDNTDFSIYTKIRLKRLLGAVALIKTKQKSDIDIACALIQKYSAKTRFLKEIKFELISKNHIRSHTYKSNPNLLQMVTHI